MTETLVVNPNPPLNPGLDYAALKAEGLALIQQLAGDIWTDYNEHDPGVTTLEQVCYALTELSYRAEFPVQDLLLSHPQDRIRLHRQALFSARRIFTCNPVTEHDYRKLLVDRVPEVANAWLTPYRGRTPHKDVNGLYDIWLYVPNADPCVCAADYQPDMIRQQAKKTYNRHRNLCEDLHRITILQGVRTAVSADVTVLEARTPELILAEILFRVENYLAPELQRQSLEALLAEGEAPSRIFNGPFLRHGFIDDAQLQPKAAEIPVRNVISVMAHTPGVTSVTNVVVRVGRQEVKTYLPQATIPVPRNEILSLDTQPGGKRGNYSIRLFKNGIEYVPDSSRVQRELDRLWAAQRRTYDVLAEYEALFAVPQGTWRNVREYYSVQNQFPEVYGIGTYGLPLEAPEIRTAQARQFKGYLMVFDQLLADFFAQLAQLKNLYTLDPKVRHTYYFQSLRKSVPDVEPLLMDHYRAGLRQLIYGQDPFVERRNRFLSFLLAMYAETIAASDLVALTDREPSENASGETLLAARQEFLQHLVAATHNRGRSFDYLAPASPRNMAGMEIKVRIQLGMEVRDRRPLIDVLEENAVELVEHESEATLGRSSNRHADHIEQEFIPVTGEPEPTVTTDPPAGLAPRLQAVTDEFLQSAGELDNYRVGVLPGDVGIALVCRTQTSRDWCLVGKYPDHATAEEAARRLACTMQSLRRHCRQLYFVEHPLLRFGRRVSTADQEQTDPPFSRAVKPQPPFQYSFTLTAVVSCRAGASRTEDDRRMVREIIRENTPAHIVAEVCFLGYAHMRRFEALYWAWRSALRHQAPWEMARTSARLRRFLETHCHCRNTSP